MNIAYLYIGKLTVGSGVYKKMIEQASKWREAGNNVKFYHVSTDDENTFANASFANVFENISNIMFYKINFKKDIEQFSDIIYMRYSFICYDIWKIMQKIPIVVEINSNEEKEYKLYWNKNFKSKIKYFWNYVNRKILMSSVKGKICVTHELAEREKGKNSQIPCIVIPNAIMGEFKNKKRLYHEKPIMIFIGSPDQPWHGVDKILSLAKKTINKLNFVIIGLSIKDEEIPANVKCCGYLSQNEYFQYLLDADIGIGSLALHRKGMNEACPLKVREYLSFGLPIIIGYDDTAFLGRNIEEINWVLKIPNTEENVSENVINIEKFAYCNKDSVVKFSDCTFMRSSVLENKRLLFFKEILNEKSIVRR